MSLKAEESTKKRKGQKSSPLFLMAAGFVPLALAAFVVPKVVTLFRKKFLTPKEQNATVTEGGAGIYYGDAGTIRKHYKVNRDQQIELLQDNRPEVEIQDHDDVVETYEEDEVEKAGAIGGGNKDMLAMLQQMGFRLVAGPDGTMMLVPPGKEGGLGLEGYDEDD